MKTAIKHEMSIMTPRDGDTKIVWDPTNSDEVEQAQKTFDELRGKGFMAYEVKRGGKAGDIIRDFDPDAEKLILSPPVVGG